MKYTVIYPFIDDMGSMPSYIVSDKTHETKEEEALWHLNRARDHDGLPHLTLDDVSLYGNGLIFKPIED